MNKTELELVPTFEEKLASFAVAFVPDLVNDICRLAKEAQENSVIVHLLDQWYENSKRADSCYKASILDTLQGKSETFTETDMTRIYKNKAFSARDLLMDYFMHNGFKK
ncbi:MAG: hypothetical protein J6S85_07255 [Methanobrevibacter sp.]|nr:hypothetical protein [Methanobrevibacter sp.]